MACGRAGVLSGLLPGPSLACADGVMPLRAPHWQWRWLARSGRGGSRAARVPLPPPSAPTVAWPGLLPAPVLQMETWQIQRHKSSGPATGPPAVCGAGVKTTGQLVASTLEPEPSTRLRHTLPPSPALWSHLTSCTCGASCISAAPCRMQVNTSSAAASTSSHPSGRLP